MYQLEVGWEDCVSSSSDFVSIEGVVRFGYPQWYYGADCKIIMPDGTIRPLTDFLDNRLLRFRKYTQPHHSAYKCMLSEKAEWFYNLTMFR